jgi:hypothetical protein
LKHEKQKTILYKIYKNLKQKIKK